MNKIKYLLLGQKGEELAANLYFTNGFQIVAKNAFNHKGKRYGEIDVVAVKGKHIHFVEVKTRTSLAFGHALEAIDHRKINKTLNAIKFFLKLHTEFNALQPHFDVVVVELSPFDKAYKKIRMYSDVIVDVDTEV